MNTLNDQLKDEMEMIHNRLEDVCVEVRKAIEILEKIHGSLITDLEDYLHDMQHEIFKFDDELQKRFVGYEKVWWSK